MGLSECQDFERESREYWEKRLEDNWDKPFHGMFFDDPRLIAKMDNRNFEILEQRIFDLYKQKGCGINVLECGCGDGRYIEPLFKDNPLIKTYVAIDFAQRNIDAAIKIHGKQKGLYILRVDMETIVRKLSMDEQKVDLIFMVSTLSSIQRNFNEIMESLCTILISNSSILVFEQEMFIEYFNNWKELP